MHAFLQELQPSPDDAIYITEKLTHGYLWLKSRFRNVTGSEYLGPTVVAGSVRRGVLHEDLQALSFPSSSFDHLLCFEVLEHVPDSEAALREIFRVLRPGGRCLLTAPIDLNSDTEVTRARLIDGLVEHLLEPEYHGNPVDISGGALCFRYFGWNVLAELRALGFADVAFLCWWSRDFGYLGFPQVAIVARKP